MADNNEPFNADRQEQINQYAKSFDSLRASVNSLSAPINKLDNDISKLPIQSANLTRRAIR
jgi:cell division protein FtsB